MMILPRASRHLAELQYIFQTCLQDAGATPARAEDFAAMLHGNPISSY